MNDKYRTIGYIGMILFVAFSSIASANSQIDKPQDVIKTIEENGTMTTLEDQIKAPIDINKINVNEIDNETIALTMVVFGDIINDSDTHYIVWFNTSTATYYMDYTNGVNEGWVARTDYSSDSPPLFAALSTEVSNGNVITATYELMGSINNQTDFWGYTITVENQSMVFEDYVPNSRFQDPNDGTSDQNTDGSDQNTDNTPGFTLILLSITFIFFSIIRKRGLGK